MSFSICQFLVVVSVAVLGMTVNVSMSARDRQKSPDDGGPLESDVEHLTRQVTSINARLNDDMSTEAAEVKANCERTFKGAFTLTVYTPCLFRYCVYSCLFHDCVYSVFFMVVCSPCIFS